MPKEGKIPPDAKLKATINAFHKEGRYTEKQYAKLSWGHLKQIGQYNHDNNHKPKPSDKSKTPAQWRAQKDKGRKPKPKVPKKLDGRRCGNKKTTKNPKV